MTEYLVGARELDHDLNRSRNAREHDLAAHRRDLAVEREDGSQSRRIEDTGIIEVQDKTPDASADLFLSGSLEFGSVTEIQRFSDPDDDNVVRDRFDVKTHGCGLHDQLVCLFVRGVPVRVIGIHGSN